MHNTALRNYSTKRHKFASTDNILMVNDPHWITLQPSLLHSLPTARIIYRLPNNPPVIHLEDGIYNVYHNIGKFHSSRQPNPKANSMDYIP
jgi:hypothetical protein